jgi:hypothetical protein
VSFGGPKLLDTEEFGHAKSSRLNEELKPTLRPYSRLEENGFICAAMPLAGIEQL